MYRVGTYNICDYMKYWAIITLLFFTLSTSAQVGDRCQGYALSSVEKRDDNKNFFESKAFDILHIGVPLAAVGLAFKPADDEFKALHDSYVYEANTHVDDYLQYAPAALMLGLKAAGVESRSSWGRMLTSDAISIVVMSLSVNGLKSAISTKRPDSSADNSFPSGHTATAFMTATMLHKEYGARSYWYSVGAYSAATATGMMRVINNRHWASDVLVGASLGILSTEVGYLLADLIFADRHINYTLDEYNTQPSWSKIESPSSVGLNLGVVVPFGKITLPSVESIKIGTGSRVGFEGAYYLNQKFGIGGRATLTTSQIKLNGETQSEELDVKSGSIGAYYSKIISRRWRASTKVLMGVSYYEGFYICDGLDIAKGFHPTLGSGVSVEYLSNRHWSMKAFCDYDLSSLPDLPNINFYHSMTFGVVGSVIF